MGTRDISHERLEKLIADVKPSGGAEMSNYQLFVERLTGALNLPQPEFAREETRFNDYVFERNVTFRHPNGTSSTGRIDCYKRGCFILEAKQSAKRQQAWRPSSWRWPGWRRPARSAMPSAARKAGTG